MHRSLSMLACAICLGGCAVRESVAQPPPAARIELIPDCDRTPDVLLFNEYATFSTDTWEIGQLKLRAMLVTGTTYVDVTDSVLWSWDRPDILTMGLPGDFRRVGQRRVRITACLGDIGEDTTTFWKMDERLPESPPPPTTPPGAAVSRDEIRTGVYNILDQVRDQGLVVQRLREMATHVVMMDDTENANSPGGAWVMRRPGNEQDAVTVAQGKSRNTLGEDTLKIKNETGSIATAFSAPHAAAIALAAVAGPAGRNVGGLDAQGRLNDVGVDIVNELTDALILDMKKRDVLDTDVPRDDKAEPNGIEPEDAWSSGVPELTRNMQDILALARATQPPTAESRQQIRNRLAALRLRMRNMQQYNPTAWLLLLQELGWNDGDNNGIPDWLESALRLLGYDPADLPAEIQKGMILRPRTTLPD